MRLFFPTAEKFQCLVFEQIGEGDWVVTSKLKELFERGI